ncbi:MAG: hypothetical protein QOE01_2406 [Actinomycetota bacterium]|nr:hypothetical protein [Actinomycetota bacterium]
MAQAWQAADTDIETALTQLAAVEAKATALRALLLAQAESRNLKERTQALSTAQWLTQRFRCSRGLAAARVREAGLLAAQPVVRTALAEGTVTVEQSRVLATALARVDAIPALTGADREEATRFLIAQAGSLSPAELTGAGQALAEALTSTPDVDDPADAAAVARELAAAEAAAQAAETNRLITKRRPGGGFTGRFTIGNADETAFAAWLRQAEKPHPGTDGFEDTRPRDQRRADHLLDALRSALGGRSGAGASGGSAAGPQTQNDGHEEAPDQPATSSGPASPADPAGHTGTHPDPDPDPDAAAAAGPGQLPLPATWASAPTRLLPSNVTIGLTVSLQALRDGLAGAGRLDTGATLSAAELRRLACDAAIIPIVMNGHSTPLDVGRKRRLHDVYQRRALYVRDQGCITPGCQRPAADCQPHHDPDWTNGGPTDIDHAALLCLYHHQQVHRQGWTVRLAANGYPDRIPPKTIDPEQCPRQHHRFRLRLLTQRRQT